MEQAPDFDSNSMGLPTVVLNFSLNLEGGFFAGKYEIFQDMPVSQGIYYLASLLSIRYSNNNELI
jgi:hypothetical protein